MVDDGGVGLRNERSHPPLGWPRETDSLCPRCVVDTRNSIIRGERDISELINGHRGEIKARIEEEGGRLYIRKRCAEHGAFEDLLSTQEGEISFCAYNTGVGWRQIVENMHISSGRCP